MRVILFVFTLLLSISAGAQVTKLIKNQAIGGQNGVKALELKESHDLQRQRLTEVYAKELEIQKRIISDQHEFDKMRLQLSAVGKKRDSVNYIVFVLVESKETR